MARLTPEQKIEKLKSYSDFAMFTKAGNNRVRTITVRAFKKAPHDHEAAYEVAVGLLDKLCREEPYTEAMDTAVRDAVFSSLHAVRDRT